MLLPALPAGCRAAGVHRAAPAARAAEPAGRDLQRRSARLPVREARGQGAGRARHGLFRAAGLPPADRRGTAARAVGRRAGALLAAVDRRAVRVGRGGLRRAAARHHADRRERGRRRGPCGGPPRRRHDRGAGAGQRAMRRSWSSPPQARHRRISCCRSTEIARAARRTTAWPPRCSDRSEPQ